MIILKIIPVRIKLPMARKILEILIVFTE